MVACKCSDGRRLEPFPHGDCTGSRQGIATGNLPGSTTEIVKMGTRDESKESADGEHQWWSWQRRVGPCCWPGKSRRTGRSPGGGFCRSFRTLAARMSTCNLVGVWVSRPSRCGSCRSRAGEGWRWFAWRPRIPSGCWASLRHRSSHSTRGTAERCASFSASIWRGYHGQQAASFFSHGAMIVARASVRLRKTHDPMAHYAKDGICRGQEGRNRWKREPGLDEQDQPLILRGTPRACPGALSRSLHTLTTLGIAPHHALTTLP